MKPEILSTSFIFTDEISAAALMDLYENDFVYIEEIFQSSLVELNESIPLIEASYTSGDLPGLKSVSHKIKPLFGFTGLLKIQTLLQEFEDVCSTYESVAALRDFYEELHKALLSGQSILAAEIEKLNEYNRLHS